MAKGSVPTRKAKKPSRMDAYERVEIESRSAWRRWLTKNHTRGESIWLVTFKKHAGARHVPYGDVVEEALCFGWIDSVPRKLDAERSMVLLSPRNAGSPWSNLNKERVARLIAGGLMTPAGQAKIDAAKADGSWTKIDSIQTLEPPKDLLSALTRNAKARVAFEGFSPSSRKAMLQWLLGAKTDATRQRRIGEIVRLAALGLRANTAEARGK